MNAIWTAIRGPVASPHPAVNSCRRSFRERGAVFIESTIALLFLLLLILGTIDLSVAIYETLSIQYSLSQTARWAAIGPNAPGATLPREESIINKAKTTAESFGIDLSNASINVCPAATPQCAPTNNAGSPSSYALLSARKPFKFFFFRTTIDLSGWALFRNEPYA
jgi:Flp pilus assembly protein TadG